MMKSIGLVGAAVLGFSVLSIACGAEGSADSLNAAKESNGGSSSSSGGPVGGSAPEGSGVGIGDGESTGTPRPSTPATPTNGDQIGAGKLTAGVWDDNLNFDFFAKYVDLSTSLSGVPKFSLDARTGARDKWLQQRAGANELDIAFLIDTTGSMGDELSYLQREIDGISAAISLKFPQTTPRFGLVLYRDHGDDYVTRWFDFKGLSEFRDNLAAQNVGGGGDLPEAAPEGLSKTMELSWRQGAVARMAFWVADAPHHEDAAPAMEAAINTAVQKDVHVYPVAASGTDGRAEFTMRSAAQMTGGRYVFLTDDSGIGNDHAEPHIPCYHVTKFNSAIVRMVESEMKGSHVSPDPEEIIRSVGTNGACITKSQANVRAY